jgi:ATP-dependent RNA helicase HelY
VSQLPTRDFRLDPFQELALAELDAGRSVLVAAPTGSGKTVVAEHAVELALAEGSRAFYTTPIKALSNQKFHDLARRHGADRVGLLTGDNAVNGDAPVVVMTTEVLRNMIYARSRALDDLRYVVLDEVHYLQDAYRGPVWEEVIVHLPAHVRLVCLSATVSNADELADWLTTVRGPTATVVEHHRPVALDHLYAVEDRGRDELEVVPILRDGQPDPRGRRFDVDPRQSWQGRGRGRGGGSAGRGGGRRPYATPDRVEVVRHLAARSMLPAIQFIFSRAACDDAVRACVRAGLRLTTAAERARVAELVEQHVGGLSDDDLAVLDHDRWASALGDGVAAHHAGMIPPFKEAVEACFLEGLVKVVFATETLALGINMPARTVVIEKLTKFTGERHEALTPAQFTQLTGRAGRRGLDEHGNAMVLWSPFVPFDEVARLAASRSFRLTSSFRPTYNMAGNLVRRYPPEEAHRLLNLSLAQYQADKGVVGLEARLARRTGELAALEAEARCELGDVEEYRRLRDDDQGGARPGGGGPGGGAPGGDDPPAEVERALAALAPGDVVRLGGPGRGAAAAVLSVAERRGTPTRATVITGKRRVLDVSAADLRRVPEVVGRVRLPKPYAPRRPSFQRAAAQAVVALTREAGPEEPPAHTSHPVHRCPDRDGHLRAARQAERARREVADLRRRIEASGDSLARRFDRILQLLDDWGHLDGWALSPKGEQLVRLYHESDLLIAEVLHTGLLDDLDPASLAGLVSCFTYEHRSPVPAPAPWFPRPRDRDRFARIEALATELNDQERRLGLPPTRRPDPGFLPLAHAWAAGEGFDEVLADETLSAGDFVRNVKQLLDLLRQVADAARSPATASAARAAADALFRGVVAASSTVNRSPHDGEGVDDDLAEAVVEGDP